MSRTATQSWSCGNARRSWISGAGRCRRSEPFRSTQSMAKRVLVECRDLFFRGKIQAVVGAGGGDIVRDDPLDLAVLELGKPGVDERIQDFVLRGVPVLAFGSHVDAEALRAARNAGARAVPNSEVETTLRALLRPACQTYFLISNSFVPALAP